MTEYNISGNIDYTSIKVNSFEVEESFITSKPLGNGQSEEYLVISIKCDIDCGVKDIVSESYYYGGTLYGLTPIKITEMQLIPKYTEGFYDIEESDIYGVLDNLKFACSFGGGWSDGTFSGALFCETNDLEENGYTDFYFNELVMHITNEGAIKALDDYVTGENCSYDYKVVDIDGIELEYFDDFDDAVKWAKENNGYQVWGSRVWYEYSITNSGEIESDVLDFDDDIGEDWTNPNYIDEDF